jgi:isocitrate lyase
MSMPRGVHSCFAVPRTPEGFYRTTGGLQAAIDRALVYAPYADLLWLETGKPDLAEARTFARKIREKYPGKWFVYNLSPSFNWSQAGFNGTSLLHGSILCLRATNALNRCRS